MAQMLVKIFCLYMTDWMRFLQIEFLQKRFLGRVASINWRLVLIEVFLVMSSSERVQSLLILSSIKEMSRLLYILLQFSSFGFLEDASHLFVRKCFFQLWYNWNYYLTRRISNFDFFVFSFHHFDGLKC